MDTKDLHEIDKSASKEILKEFRGKTISHVCPSCNGTGKIGVGKHHEFIEPCFECNGTKKILIQW